MTSQISKLKSASKTFWNNSQTKVWSYIQASAGAVIFTLGQLHSYITDPTIKSYLDGLNLPKEVTLGLVVFGLITYVCHGHKDE